jgi:hypothetical protein
MDPSPINLPTPLEEQPGPESLSQNRLFVSATVNTMATGVKSLLEKYFIEKNIGATIERPRDHQTIFCFEGIQYQILLAQKDLQSLLNEHCPGVEVTYSPRNSSTKDRLDKVTVKGTSPDLKRSDSSGNFGEVDLIFNDDTVSVTSSFQRGVEWLNSLKPTLLFQAVGSCRQIASNAQNVLSTNFSKPVKVQYLENLVGLNVGACIVWNDFITIIKSEKSLKIAADDTIVGIYCMDENQKCLVHDLQLLKADSRYYVQTESSLKDSKPKFSTLEEFFKALKDEEDMIDELVLKAKAVFAEQGITFKQLMKTGDLAMTDSELKEYGIAQGGLRKAILSLIKGNRQ